MGPLKVRVLRAGYGALQCQLCFFVSDGRVSRLGPLACLHFRVSAAIWLNGEVLANEHQM